MPESSPSDKQGCQVLRSRNWDVYRNPRQDQNRCPGNILQDKEAAEGLYIVDMQVGARSLFEGM